MGDYGNLRRHHALRSAAVAARRARYVRLVLAGRRPGVQEFADMEGVSRQTARFDVSAVRVMRDSVLRDRWGLTQAALYTAVADAFDFLASSE